MATAASASAAHQNPEPSRDACAAPRGPPYRTKSRTFFLDIGGTV